MLLLAWNLTQLQAMKEALSPSGGLTGTLDVSIISGRPAPRSVLGPSAMVLAPLIAVVTPYKGNSNGPGGFNSPSRKPLMDWMRNTAVKAGTLL